MSVNLNAAATVRREKGNRVTLGNLSRTTRLESLPDPSTRRQGNRSMHESTLTMTDSAETNYTTVMAESYCGRDPGGQPLIFFHRDAEFPSQHISTLDLSNTSITYTPTHSRDVHSPKDVIPHNVLRSYGLRNFTHNHQGLAMKEVTNPPGLTLYQSSYHDSHQRTSASISHCIPPTGRPTPWHSHNILTGEEVRSADPGKARKTARNKPLCAQQPWETDCTALRLY
ncbi:hypothetical protein ACEWY4_002369 [Coilia grayii]|uniref:Uncharacterized protein n=1 Tax=Coilia grayii TaxID=363190 RepID=A0ABD1KP83_9TELE